MDLMTLRFSQPDTEADFYSRTHRRRINAQVKLIPTWPWIRGWISCVTVTRKEGEWRWMAVGGRGEELWDCILYIISRLNFGNLLISVIIPWCLVRTADPTPTIPSSASVHLIALISRKERTSTQWRAASDNDDCHTTTTCTPSDAQHSASHRTALMPSN